ncbi:MAG: hypothetical protein LIR50_21765 [Bacillota bacterium]|nr:hypothetical protein [Bacillota bacterium]
MLISELRDLIKSYKDENLRLIISEMYKSMPKKLREEKDIDTLLQDPSAYIQIGKIEKVKNKQVNIDAMQREINRFIEYAYKQCYCVPNNMVRKNERPKWRFKVKTYVRDLQEISIDSREGSIATELLLKLYEMLSYACGYYIFNTDNPFRSVGIEQTSLLETVIARRLGCGINQDNIKSVINLVINSIPDRETLHSSLICTLIMNLKSSDSKEIAVEQCKQIIKELQKPKQASSKKSWSMDSSDYQREEKIHNLVEMVFRINIELCEFDEAIQFFNKKYIERDAGITLYVLLELLWEYELKELWMQEYEKALKNGVKPREKLINMYEYIQENNSLPENFYI